MYCSDSCRLSEQSLSTKVSSSTDSLYSQLYTTTGRHHSLSSPDPLYIAPQQHYFSDPLEYSPDLLASPALTTSSVLSVESGIPSSAVSQRGGFLSVGSNPEHHHQFHKSETSKEHHLRHHQHNHHQSSTTTPPISPLISAQHHYPTYSSPTSWFEPRNVSQQLHKADISGPDHYSRDTCTSANYKRWLSSGV